MLLQQRVPSSKRRPGSARDNFYKHTDTQLHALLRWDGQQQLKFGPKLIISTYYVFLYKAY